MDIHKNTSLNIDLSNIIFHYSKELLFKHELKEVMNELEKFNNNYDGPFYIYHLHGKWIFISGYIKYTDYSLNLKYKSKRLYAVRYKESIWDFYKTHYSNGKII
jgi:hypothetical protein